VERARVQDVHDAASLTEFIERLRGDDELRGLTLDGYLEQMQAYVADGAAAGHAHLSHTDHRAWQLVAEVLFAAALYE
jgi:hypothetical protein